MSDDNQETTRPEPEADVAELSAEVIRNAVSTEVKERFGEAFFVRHAVVVALVERPRTPLEGPEAERFSLFVKNLHRIHPEVGVKMMQGAAAEFQSHQARQSQENR